MRTLPIQTILPCWGRSLTAITRWRLSINKFRNVSRRESVFLLTLRSWIGRSCRLRPSWWMGAGAVRSHLRNTVIYWKKLWRRTRPSPNSSTSTRIQTLRPNANLPFAWLGSKLLRESSLSYNQFTKFERLKVPFSMKNNLIFEKIYFIIIKSKNGLENMKKVN